MRFTDRAVAALKPGPSIEVLTESAAPPHLRGLQLVVSPAGTKAWRLRYKVAGRTRYLVLGHYPDVRLADAHDRVAQLRRQLREGIDPKAESEAQRVARAAAPTVSDLFADFRDEYLRRHRKRPGDAEAILTNHVLAPWGDRRADSVTTREVIELVREIRDRRGPRIAEVVRGLVGQMFRHGVLSGLVTDNPAAQLRAIGTRWVQRTRVLSDDEIVQFWSRLDDAAMEPPTRLALRLLLVTGQRRGEIAQARWADIDWKAKVWTVPAANAKNAREHRVPLTPLAITLLRELESHRRPGGSFVVPTRLLEDRPIDAMAITRALRNNLEHLGFEGEGRAITPHDLRRTVATGLSALGTPRFIVARVLNHTDQDVTAGYDRHDYLPEMREALGKWARHLQGLLRPKATRRPRAKRADG